ncbi:hypothetical protein [Breznakiella homolactica]|uniref:Uncharacterized protein n=1 Tax=Breznakiella homolactica TaxID=2798577 RepID=A0A7T7XNU7_9SPIR|nr:hypothetical protein [Breznakiella homolactica]QQO09751.1 hypothetical protein JFL75_02230 [Breznakiella homolactica]
MSVLDIKDELLRLEYPFLEPDNDPEIERYYELRAIGRSQAALDLYRNRLKIRYPEDELRTAIMRAYRSRDPAYPALLHRAYDGLRERSLNRIKRTIDYIAGQAESYNPRDVYSTIKTAENLLMVLPKEKFEAVSGIERYSRYAQSLNYRVKSMAKAVELVRAYVTETLGVVQEELRRRRKQEALDAERERRQLLRQDRESYLLQRKNGPGANHPFIDFSAIEFSPEDLKRIEISPDITGIEDQTLAYCYKYWNLVADPAFERILFLYSRKFNTKNYDIYLTIRRGRGTKNRDDEILASVLSSLVTGYYYSIQGDIYLQRRWNLLKASLSQPARAEPDAPAGTDRVPKRPGPRKRKKTAVSRKKSSGKTGTAAKTGRPKAAPGSGNVKKVKTGVKNMAKKKKANRKTAGIPPAGKTPERKIPRTPAPADTSRKVLTGSVSDRLRELSGRSYDLYQDRFLAKTRAAIRKQLGTRKGFIYTLPEEAENLVFSFLRDHYSDPFMDWADSGERKRLADLGFDVGSLNPIIDEVYRRL